VEPTQGITEWVSGTFLRDKVAWGVRMTADFDLLPRLRMR